MRTAPRPNHEAAELARLAATLLLALTACSSSVAPESDGAGGALGGGAASPELAGGGGAEAGGSGGDGAGGSGDPPTCQDHVTCSGDYRGSWSLDIPCHPFMESSYPIACSDSCIIDLPACESSFITWNQGLTKMDVEIGADTFSWSSTNEQQGSLHVKSVCALALGYPTLEAGCSPAELGGMFLSFVPPTECHVDGDECVCPADSTEERTESGTYSDLGNGQLMTSSPIGSTISVCAGGEKLWVEITPLLENRHLLKPAN